MNSKCALCLFLLGALLCFAFAKDDQPSSRLALAVQKPTVVNTTNDTVTVAFKSGPNLKNSFFEVKCTTGAFRDCTAPAEGVPQNGTLPKFFALVSATINGLEPETSYNCFVIASWNKFTKCMGVKGNATTLATASAPPPPPL